MDVSSVTGQDFAVGVMKIAHNAAKAEGEGTVALIEEAGQVAAPVGVNGEGTHINTYG
jgi:hypothetical protein